MGNNLIFLQLLIYLLVGVITCAVDIWLTEDYSKTTILKKWLIDTLLTNAVALLIVRFVLNIQTGLIPAIYTTNFAYKYLALALGIGLGLNILKAGFQGAVFLEKAEGKATAWQIVLSVISCILFALGTVCFIGTSWFIDFFGRLTPEQFIFNFKSPVKGTASNMTDQIVGTPVLFAVGLLIIFAVLLFANKDIYVKDYRVLPNRVKRILFALFSLGFLAGGIFYSIKELQLDKVYAAYFDQSNFIKDEYVNPNDVKLTFPKQKRNVIHLYLESIENSYFDKANGGFMDENLMPDLMELSKEGIHFSESKTFGGPYQTYGSSWSVASMVNMSSGLPLKIPMEGNSYGKTGQFLPGATLIGDILEKQGYEQTIMFGADADFGGLTSFFTTHGHYNIFDVKYARKSGLIPKDYNVWWGFEDNKLYDFAKAEMTRLANTGKPFNFTMENADTHFPDGFVEPDTPKIYPSQYANVIHHSQKQVVDLVRWIQQQPFYKDSVIILTGDHPSMDKKFFANFDPNYHRTTFNLILNADFDQKNINAFNRKYAPYDYFPTILASMGVKIQGNRLGLGSNLASDTPTLIEKYGLDKVNTELSKNSNYYNDAFVDEKNAK